MPPVPTPRRKGLHAGQRGQQFRAGGVEVGQHVLLVVELQGLKCAQLPGGLPRLGQRPLKAALGVAHQMQLRAVHLQ